MIFILSLRVSHLRNEFHFWHVNGIMNNLGLLQETRSIHDSMNIPEIKFIAYILHYNLIYRNNL